MIKWWLELDTSQAESIHDITCKCGGDVVIRHNTLRDLLVEKCHQAHLSVQIEAGNVLTTDHSHTWPADLLVANWASGRAAAFDISVTSPLYTLTFLKAGVPAGCAALAAEERMHVANDAKCHELGWICVPLVTEYKVLGAVKL